MSAGRSDTAHAGDCVQYVGSVERTRVRLEGTRQSLIEEQERDEMATRLLGGTKSVWIEGQGRTTGGAVRADAETCTPDKVPNPNEGCNQRHSQEWCPKSPTWMASDVVMSRRQGRGVCFAAVCFDGSTEGSVICVRITDRLQHAKPSRM